MEYLLFEIAHIHFLFKHLDFRLCEIPRADSPFKEEVEFGKGSAGWFGDAEIGVDDAEEADTRLGKRESQFSD